MENTLKMAEPKPYKCVNCGAPSSELYRTYGPSVLKLSNCAKCNGIVDKYIEYDPVIVMIDLVLVSKEAQRHILFNTNFKVYWKLFILLLLLETYGLWRRDSLFNIGVNTLCGIENVNHTNISKVSPPVTAAQPERWPGCRGWLEQRGEEGDLFIWEKDYYIQFLSTFCGIVVFIVTFCNLMRLMKKFTKLIDAPLLSVLKSFSLAHTSLMFTLSMLVWGNTGLTVETRTVHYLLIFAYSFAVYLSVFTVLYECSIFVTFFVLIISNVGKYLTTFHMTPLIKEYVEEYVT